MNNKSLYIKNEDGIFSEATKDMILNCIGEKDALYIAQKVYEKNVIQRGEAITNKDIAVRLLKTALQCRNKERFVMLILDSQNKLIKLEVVAEGTIDSATIYPRYCVELMLKHSGKSAIISHNHPTNNITPSQSDKNITRTLKDAFSLFSMEILDHIIIGDEVSGTYSFVEHGLL